MIKIVQDVSLQYGHVSGDNWYFPPRVYMNQCQIEISSASYVDYEYEYGYVSDGSFYNVQPVEQNVTKESLHNQLAKIVRPGSKQPWYKG